MGSKLQHISLAYMRDYGNLEDVYRITRLPIMGKLVNMIPVLSMDRVERWVVWLMGSDDVNYRKRGVFLMIHVPKDPPA